MKLSVLGSSSSGNCYLLTTKSGQTLIIEAGISIKEIKEALNFDLSKVIACIATHRHGDHFKYAAEYMQNGIEVCSGVETLDSIDYSHKMRVIQKQVKHTIGEFVVMAVEVKHDVHCFSFLIQHPESGLILFATDTMYLPYKFPGLNNLILECNYSQEILDSRLSEGETIDVVRNRVIGSHMSLETAKDFLRANDLTGVNNIVLIHLSDGNSNAALFKTEIENLTAKSVFVADKGMNIDFNVTPF